MLRPLRVFLTARPMLWFGGISYPLYLIHAPVQRLLMLALGPVAHSDWAVFTLLWGPPAILAPIVLAYALHRWVEVPCWRWSRRLAAYPATTARVESFLVLFFKKELLFAKGRKDSHQPIDGG
jgi:peptidoglycan/LPS O-acetylase OafA/YrhL